MTGQHHRRPHILVIDDDRDIRESIRDLLEQDGCLVTSAADGLRALTYLRQCSRPPDLILLDLAMPRMNGFQFREAQLEEPDYAGIPVAIVSAETCADSIAGMRPAAVIPKPLNVKSLQRLIRSLPNARHSR